MVRALPSIRAVLCKRSFPPIFGPPVRLRLKRLKRLIWRSMR